MCGRFALTLPAEQLELAFPWLTVPKGMHARYNVAPSQPVSVVPNNNPTNLELFRWGLIPSWAKDPKIGYRMINARAETLAEKPSFRNAFRRRRCLILADGFYEWQKGAGKTKIPHFIRMRDEKPFAFAGLWEVWQNPDGSMLPTCTIITTAPNELVEPLHNRMPVILSPTTYEFWLDPAEKSSSDLKDLLQPYPAGEMKSHRVSTLVNNPRNDVAECTLPVKVFI